MQVAQRGVHHVSAAQFTAETAGAAVPSTLTIPDAMVSTFAVAAVKELLEACKQIDNSLAAEAVA